MRHRKAHPDGLSRRDFLWQATCAAVGATAMANTVWDLRMMNAAIAQTALPPTDYKALVCLFLYGGNDSNNLIIPTDSFYSSYAAARGGIAIPNAGQPGGALALTQNGGDGRTYGVHPSMPELQNLFNTGRVAIVANTGTLVGPVTRAQYLAKSVPVPPQLFSHNDQQVQWQTSVPDKISRTGWGGRCADLLNSNYNPSSTVSMSISLAGTNTWEVGNAVSEYNVSTAGPTNITGPATAQVQALKDLIALNHDNLYQKQTAKVTQTALDNYTTLSTALASAQSTTTFPNTSVGNQLKMISRIIKCRDTLKHNRQIFFASVSGYDTHDTQLSQQTTLYSQLSLAMNAFNTALTTELGIPNSVTTFTASDFGRTFPVNGGLGSDHGWGSHHLVMGGAVNGAKIYGTFPTLAVNGPDDTGLGRWIPTTAVDEYSATLAKWFGLTDAQISTVFPNIRRFARPDIGFLNIP
jgi:uncharacterized protein (DUF1501 family)